jgi:diguanylate cyclase (GGDEF)-like protein
MSDPITGGADETADELVRVQRELEFRTTVTTAMLSTLDLEQILYVILCGITHGEGLGFNRAFLFLDDDAGRALNVTMAVGPSSQAEAVQIWDGINRDQLTLTDLLPRYEIYRSDPLAQALTRKLTSFSLPLLSLATVSASSHVLLVGKEAPLGAVMARCLAERTPFASNALTLRHEVSGPAGELIEFRNVAIVPLVMPNRLIGAILADNVYNGHEVGSDDLRRLHGMGNLAALAIDRARLHAKTLAMAEVDGLTGVYNRRHYEAELVRFLEATRRKGQILSIVVFDLDHFKSYNDQHGHLVGDQLLKDVAQMLVEHVRQTDIVARYGGEEFVVLLCDTRGETAAAVAEKLRQLVSESRLASGRVGGLTLSAGVASTTGEDTPEQLFERADRALYQAKEAGRDRVVVWTDEVD